MPALIPPLSLSQESCKHSLHREHQQFIWELVQLLGIIPLLFFPSSGLWFTAFSRPATSWGGGWREAFPQSTAGCRSSWLPWDVLVWAEVPELPLLVQVGALCFTEVQLGKLGEQQHGIREWVGLEGALKTILFQPQWTQDTFSYTRSLTAPSSLASTTSRVGTSIISVLHLDSS